jgi:transketolase
VPRPDERDALAIATVRFLAVDMVEAAASGHPGAPLGLAPLAHVLWSRHLRADPADPAWPDRDRFVLSCGHASALLYALLHLAGYDLPLAELRRFRQLDSKTPGHPEHGHTPGVETTTGPLGQGLGNAVGMALAQRALAARFNRDGFPLFDHRIWAFVSDGDLMEGVASEASSLAGHQRLGRLKVFYDSNGISIDGPTTLAFTEDVAARYAAYGWRVLRVEDGNDLDELEGAVAAAGAEDELPTLVVVRTHIGYGSPKQDTAAVHGAPLGAEAARATREKLGWPHAETFVVPDAARELYAETATRNAVRRRAWRELLGRYRAAHPEPAAERERRLAGRLPEGWDAELPVYGADAKPIATRAASGQALNALARRLPELVGGSADLAESNLTTLHGEASAQAGSPAGRNFNFGVREHAMASALNGLALSGLLRPYGGTFLIFSDYLKPALRLAALMRLPVVHVFTHDSLFLGEDGPTHQPIGQLAGLRAIPGLVVLRPGDARETNEAWRVAIERRDGPTALALTRQKLPVLAETAGAARSGVARGAYVLWRSGPDDDGVALLATGSELHVALGAGKRLAEGGVAARVVSMPSWELFERQEPAYRESVLPRRLVRRLAVEAASPFGWHRWVGSEGAVQGIETFGASAPAEALAPRFGLTVEAVLERALALAGRPV